MPRSDERVEITTEEKAYSGQYEKIMVGTTATLIRPANPDRISILIQNLSNTGSDNLYLGFDRFVTTTNGIFIQEKGAWDSDTWGGELYGISDGDPVDVRYMEEERD